jgi:kynurenine formamidase
LEATANLDAVPATGATLVVGSPKVEGCTGGPARLFALV